MDIFLKKWEALADPRYNPMNYPHLTVEEQMLGVLSVCGLVSLPKPESTYEVGVNIANTPGHVVFENHVCQLLRYVSPKGIKYNTPLFIVPPWINKFYIFDLGEKKSIIKWLMDEGFEVYCLSWINADKSHAHISLQDFIDDAILRCATFIKDASNVEQIHGIGYCIGGVGLCMSLMKNAQLFEGVTLLATPFNFKRLKELNQQMNTSSFHYVRQMIQQEGVCHGDRLFHMFSHMRAHEMIYQDVVDRIYLKKTPKVIDYLHWNGDVSNIPGRVHLEYVDEIFAPNSLLSNLQSLHYQGRVFIVCAQKDHIVPVEASMEGMTVFANAKICVTQGGHVAGIVHDPHAHRYANITSDTIMTDNEVKEAMHKAKDLVDKKSWWQEWLLWHKESIKPRSKSKKTRVPTIEAAPGRYVRQAVAPLQIQY